MVNLKKFEIIQKGSVTHRMADDTQINILYIQCKRRTKKCFVVQYRF